MTLQRIQLIGFAPDLAQDTPGVIVASNRIIPTTRGFTSGAQAATTNKSVSTGSNTGVYIAHTQAGTAYYYLGTATKLQVINSLGTSVTDKSGSTYNSTLTGDGGWSFCAYGDKTIASNKFDTIQVADTGTGTFADISGAPKASIVQTVGPSTAPFLMAFNYNDGTDTPNGVFWSALGDYTDWTPDTATQCGNVPLLEPSGPITAAKRFRDGVVVFKEDAMFLGTYIGTPNIWQFQCVARGVGCTAKNMVTEAGDALYFADKRGAWKYDGSYPQLLPGAVHDFWARQLHPPSLSSVGYSQVVWDPFSHNLWICGSRVGYLVWNAISGLWTYHDRIANSSTDSIAPFVQQLFGFIQQSVGVIKGVAEYNDGSTGYYVDTCTFGDSYKTNEATVSLTMGQFGDPIRFTQISRVAPVWLSPWPAVIGSYTPITGGYTPDSHASCVVDVDSS